MPLIALVGRTADENRRLQLAGPQVYLAGLDVKRLDRQQAHAVRPGQLDLGVPGKQRGGGIRARHAVAGIAPNGADVADLRAADLVHRLAEHADVPLDDGVLCNVGKARERPDPDRPVRLKRHAAQLVEPIDADQLAPGQPALAHLHEHVAAAGNDLRLRVRQQQFDGVGNGGPFIQCLDVVHVCPSSTVK